MTIKHPESQFNRWLTKLARNTSRRLREKKKKWEKEGVKVRPRESERKRECEQGPWDTAVPPGLFGEHTVLHVELLGTLLHYPTLLWLSICLPCPWRAYPVTVSIPPSLLMTVATPLPVSDDSQQLSLHAILQPAQPWSLSASVLLMSHLHSFMWMLHLGWV